jgi:hypothetical protein
MGEYAEYREKWQKKCGHEHEKMAKPDKTQ